MSTAIIIGAGFSCEAHLPNTQDVARTFLEPQIGDLPAEIEIEITHQLARFWKYAFGYVGGAALPSLEDHFTVIDLAANSGRNIGPMYTPKKLRAIRRLSIHRVFQILDRRFEITPSISTFLRLHENHASIISTNWDVVVEKHLNHLGIPFTYSVSVENLEGHQIRNTGMQLLMLHGSANWIYCDSCRRLFAGDIGDGKLALHANIYISTDDFRELGPHNNGVFDVLGRMGRAQKTCVHCGNRLGARIATFSYRKEISISQFQAVWQQAYETLRDSSKWIFIGYSLPDADYEFRHLLKSAEKATKGSGSKNIKVILKDHREAGERFQRFFGLQNEQIHQHGLSGCIANRCLEEQNNASAIGAQG